MHFSARDGQKLPLLFDIRLGEALADICRERWPSGTRKHVAREWDLGDQHARSVCRGDVSKADLEHIFRHKRGGWPLILEVFARFLGEGVDQHLERERRRHENRAQQMGEHLRDLRLAVSGDHRDGPGERVRVAGRGPSQRRDVGE